MLEETLQIQDIAKQARLRGEYIDIALGKYKVPLTIKEAIKKYKHG